MKIPVSKVDEQMFTTVLVDVHAGMVYDSLQAAAILGIRGKTAASRRQTLYQIPQDQLPVRRRGPRGKLRGYLGRDLLRYLGVQDGVPEGEPVVFSPDDPGGEVRAVCVGDARQADGTRR